MDRITSSGYKDDIDKGLICDSAMLNEKQQDKKREKTVLLRILKNKMETEITFVI